MIKYVELTAPNASAFRQAKILSIECNEGDEIKEGDTLFKVQSGSHQINLPAIKAGRIVELIATVHENITLSTALLLLETKVKGSSASKSIAEEPPKDSPNKVPEEPNVSAQSKTDNQKTPQAKKEAPISAQPEKKKSINVTKKHHEQQSLNLIGVESGSEQAAAAPQKEEQQEVVLTQSVTPPSSPAIQNTIKTSPTMTSSANKSSPSSIEISVPDIGADSAKVIEIFVAVGDSVSIEDPLITLESDKASMDVPSSATGTIKSIEVSMDQDVSEGTIIVTLETSGESSNIDSAKPSSDHSAPKAETAAPEETKAETSVIKDSPKANTEVPANEPIAQQGKSHASPSIRRFARELGVDLSQLSGSGRKGRITQDDVKGYVKGALSKSTSSNTGTTSGARNSCSAPHKTSVNSVRLMFSH